MKNIFYVLLITVSFFLSACSKSEGTGATLVGKWKADSQVITSGIYKNHKIMPNPWDYMDFKSNGNLEIGQQTGDVFFYKYKIEGSKMTMTTPSHDVVFNIVKLSFNYATITNYETYNNAKDEWTINLIK